MDRLRSRVSNLRVIESYLDTLTGGGSVNSPLGKYSQIVAAFTAVGIIGGYVVGLVANLPGVNNLEPIAYIAVGAVFGSAAGVNGWKSEVGALHARLDRAGVPAARTISQ